METAAGEADGLRLAGEADGWRLGHRRGDGWRLGTWEGDGWRLWYGRVMGGDWDMGG